ncbi:MAG: response regulator transcription factor [Opitutales bacterium]|jgi:two-component system phosphate regulon response regulator PhoB
MSKNPPKRILVVDDEPDVTELVSYRLRKEGYEVEVINNPLLIMGKATEFRPDLFILDIMMPELDGIKICRMLRADKNMSNSPVVFLTARGGSDDRIKGLESGADDYIAKPFDVKELVLRVGLLLKRVSTGKAPDGQVLKVGSVILDQERHSVTVNGDAVDLTATEFKLLNLLMERKGRVQSREILLINVWNYDTDTETRTIDTHVRRLREKLGNQSPIIETVRGVGYRVNDA